MLDGWFLIASVAVTGFFTIGGVLLGTRREAHQWRRDARKQVYAELLSESDAAFLDAYAVADRDLDTMNEAPSDEWVAALVKARYSSIPAMATIAILGPASVHEAAVRLSHGASKDLDDHVKFKLQQHQDVIDALERARSSIEQTMNRLAQGDVEGALRREEPVGIQERSAPESRAYNRARQEFVQQCRKVLNTN